MFVIETRSLRKTFQDDVAAVDDVSLQIAEGSVYGLIGKNGAGKTTLLRLLAGVLRPDKGSAHLFGQSMMQADTAVRQRFTYVSQEDHLPSWMTVEELCHFVSHFYTRWDKEYARELIERFEIVPGKKIGVMSGGQKRQAAILLAFAARPELLLLDEPAAGLDPISRRELMDQITTLLSGSEACTVILSTHIISDLERVADLIGIMDKGKIVMSKPLDELKQKIVRVQIIFPGQSVPDDFQFPEATNLQKDGPVAIGVIRGENEDVLERIRLLPGVRVQTFPMGLEDSFFELFGRSGDISIIANGQEKE